MPAYQIKGRLTHNKIVQWVNSEFERLEIKNFNCIKSERTYYTQDQYECGAYKILITIEDIDTNKVAYLYCYYSLSEIKDHLNSGYELYLKFDRFYIINNTGLELRKL